MTKVVKVCGGSIALEAKPAKAKPGANAGTVHLACTNGSNLAYFVEVAALDSQDPSAAATTLINTLPRPKVAVNGRKGALTILPTKREIQIGHWDAIAVGDATLRATVSVTHSTQAVTSHNPTALVKVR